MGLWIRHVQHQSSHRSSKKEVGESTTRGSPTTPLSWSGGDSYDDSTLPPRPPPPPPPPPLPAFRSIKLWWVLWELVQQMRHAVGASVVGDVPDSLLSMLNPHFCCSVSRDAWVVWAPPVEEMAFVGLGYSSRAVVAVVAVAVAAEDYAWFLPLMCISRILGAGGSDASNRKTRKKKTFAELKEEECLLLKESVYLKREVAKLQAVWEEERIQNNNLKRMKLELQRQSVNETSASDVLKETSSCDPLSHSNRDQNDTVSPSNGSECCGLDAAASCTPHLSDTSVAPIVATTWKNPEVPSVAANQKSFVVLPDLNLPLEEDYVPEDLYGTS
ncbi:hypothetical protein Scep_008297 [Stephania cephalantha]|uniref:Uncharacterized protein n=1 Tax=Stephania cephalantha TaxID=152367 RepID=A0AAP0KCN3_9MAGN